MYIWRVWTLFVTNYPVQSKIFFYLFLCVVFWENVMLLQTKKMSPCNTTTTILNLNLGGKREIETSEKKRKRSVWIVWWVQQSKYSKLCLFPGHYYTWKNSTPWSVTNTISLLCVQTKPRIVVFLPLQLWEYSTESIPSAPMKFTNSWKRKQEIKYYKLAFLQFCAELRKIKFFSL